MYSRRGAAQGGELHQERFLDERPPVLLEPPRPVQRREVVARLVLRARGLDDRDRELARVEQLLQRAR